MTTHYPGFTFPQPDLRGAMRFLVNSRFVAVLTATALALPVAAGAQQLELASTQSLRTAATRAPLDMPARLKVADVPLAEALAQLQRQSGVALAYSPTLAGEAGRVSCACERATVKEALDLLLARTGFRYASLDEHVVIERVRPPVSSGAPASHLEGAATAPAATPSDSTTEAPRSPLAAIRDALARLVERADGRIEGRVVEAETGLPVPGAQVVIEQTAFGATTNADGRYVIPAVPAGVHAVVARRIGFAMERRDNIRVRDDSTIVLDFTLRRSVLQLEEVVSTGVVDPTSGLKVPFTVARLSDDQLEVPSTNAIASIQGKIAGVNMVQSSEPGAGINILLRTPTTINKSNSPLIVVDGVILSNTFGSSSTDLDALDIESIEVVKGAAAASLYGSRAANGVIQIRTRRGNGLGDGETRFAVRTEAGTSELGRRVAPARFHNYLTNDAGQYVDAAGNVVARGDRIERPAAERFQDVPYIDPTFDHIDQFFDPGDFMSATASLAQGGTSTNFYASVSTHKTSGIVLDNGGYRKNDIRLNLDHRLRADLGFSFSGYHMRSDLDDVPAGTFSGLAQQSADADLLQPDPDGTPYVFQPDLDFGREPNPLYAIAVLRDVEERARTLGNVGLRYSPLPWASVDGELSYDRSDRNYDLFHPRGKQTEVQERQSGYLQRATGLTNTLNGSVSANFIGSMRDVTARATVRALMEREHNEFFEAEALNLGVDDTPDLDLGAVTRIGSEFQDIRSSAYFLIAGADFRDTYIADAVLRRDGSSLFGPDDRWHTYYRASFAYRIAEEPWWPVEQLNELKLRISRGTAGNRPDFIDRFETYDVGEGGTIGGVATLGNRRLRPEHATETELGLDAIAYERVSLQLNYAKVRTTDQLVLVPLPAAFGANGQWQNAGTIEGNTVEATLEAVLFDRGTTRWTLGLVADRSRHRVTEFNRSCFRQGEGSLFYYCEGERLGVMYGQAFATSTAHLPEGAAATDEFQVNDDGLLVWVGSGGSYRDGQWGTTGTVDGTVYDWGMPVLRRDAAGTALITRIGDGNPDFRFGISNSVRWRFLSFYGLVDAQRGGQVYNRTKQRMYQYFRSGDVDQAGVPEELKKTTDYYTDLYNGNTVNQWFVEDASYVKLRELSLRVEAPESWRRPLGSFGAERLALSLVGRNLVTWTDYSGFDPEVGTPLERVDNFAYPQFRTFTAAVEVAF